MIKMVNFVLCSFYYNKKEKEIGKDFEFGKVRGTGQEKDSSTIQFSLSSPSALIVSKKEPELVDDSHSSREK